MKKILVVLSFIGALLLALSVPAAAAEDTVAYISYTGSDTNDGLTPTTPKRSFGASSGSGAISLLQDGGTLVVVGKGYIGVDYSMPALSDTLTITSVYDGVDYKNASPADNPACAFKMYSGATMTINSDVIFDDIIMFQENNQNTIVISSGATLTVTDSVVFQSRTGVDYHYKIVIESGSTAILSEEAQEVFTIENNGGTLEIYGEEPDSEPDLEPEPEPEVTLEDFLQYANADAFLYYRVGTSSVSEYCGAFSDGIGYSLISSSGTLPSSGSMLRALRVLVPVSIVGDGTYLFNYYFSTISDVYSTYANSWYASSVVVHYADGTTEIVSVADNVASIDGFYANLTKNSFTDSLSQSGYVKTSLFSASFVVSDPEIIGFEVVYKGTTSSSSSADGGLFRITSEPMTIMNVTNATLTDVVTELNKVVVATQSSSTSISSSVSSAMQDVAEILKSSSTSQTEALQASLGELQKAIKEVTETMAEAVEEGTKSAMEEFFDDLKQKTQEAATSAINSVTAKIDETFPSMDSTKKTFQLVYGSVSSHEMLETITFPAGTITFPEDSASYMGGRTFTFWEETEIPLGEYFNQPIVKLLLIPLRFMFCLGFFKLIWEKIDAILCLVTLDGDYTWEEKR